jgi:formylmethanofuran dehydrogenase subunit D
VPHVPARDSYSHRLLATRRLYDGGAVTDGSPGLAALVTPAEARVNPHDLDQLGVMNGDPVRVRAAQFSSLVTVRSDADVPRGVVDLGFNVPFSEKGRRDVSDDDTATVADLIDVTAVVTDVRLETP